MIFALTRPEGGEVMRTIRALLILVFASCGTVFAQQQPYGIHIFTDWRPSTIRLDISPDDAQVFVDRHFSGPVSQFGGRFKSLSLHAGPHLIEIRKAGLRSLALEVMLYPGQNVTLSRAMRPGGPGELSGSEAEVTVPSFDEGAFLPAADGRSGELRFDVKPKDAEIYADGFYLGIVDDFNGSQHMMLTQGTHHLVLKRDGYQTIEANVTIESDRPLTYRTALAAATRTPVQLTASSAIR